MQPREKFLATVLAVIAAVFVLRPVLDGLFVAPLRDRDSTIKSSKEVVRGLDDKELDLKIAQRRLSQGRMESLPPKPVDAQREYQEWLFDIALLSNWRDPKISTGSQTPRGPMTGIPITIEAQATLEDVNRFLERLESTPLLQRVVHLRLDSPSFDGNPLLAVALTVEGMAVKDAPPRTRLFPTAELKEGLDEDDTTITVQNADGFPKQAPFLARLDREVVQVESIDGDQWTVVRGADGTSASEHDAPMPIELTPSRGPAVARSHPMPAVHRLFVKAPEAGELRLAAELTPAVQGKAWTAELKVQNWDPDRGVPKFRLDDGAPVGMTLDARDGTLKWTPAADFAIGKVTVPVAVLGDGESPVIEEKLQVEVRRPNSPPRLETPETVDVWLGRPWEYAVKVDDPDLPNDKLAYSLSGDVPDGLTIDRDSGVMSWSPPAEADLGDSEVEVTVSDSGQPAETDTRALTLRLTDDSALYTYFIAVVVHDGQAEAWLYDRSTNRRTLVREGEEFRIADVTGKVARIREDVMDVESGAQMYRLELGQNLRNWTPAGQAEGSPSPDPASGSDADRRSDRG